MDEMRLVFGDAWWAEAVYDADIRRPPANDPYRQETNKWLADWLGVRGVALDTEQVERLRKVFARPLPKCFGLVDGAREALAWCRSQGLFVGVLTNTLSRGDDEVRADFERLGLSDSIDLIVTSYSTGWEKPHPAMFERALREAKIRASEACMVGDSLDLDIAGAIGVAMRSVWISTKLVRQTTRFPELTIASLRELPETLSPWLSRTT